MVKPAALLLASILLAASAKAQDAREAAVRTPAEKAFILGQMRLFLGSVQVITTALANGQMQTVASEAAARGRQGTPLSSIPPGLKAKETAAWTAMMGNTRQGFDAMATAAAEGATPMQALSQLGDTMHNCVACHNTYRLVEP